MYVRVNNKQLFNGLFEINNIKIHTFDHISQEKTQNI